ncbi:GCN5-related N-acetyltransferase [Terriglobus saanensis SP1PR4]|uniref:GCN5-related N-acetyltransferase n=2 Tax=Terriglobus saanensis TaxID=870903 RepID=E8V5H4_TERSS|nr:GCN5-related N-acetyltransferase [Terriglobus saanensis SP1PR4]
MHKIRLATVDDAATISRQRRLMFADNFSRTEQEFDQLEAAFTEWVTPRLADGSYLGWFAVEDDTILAACGLWIMDFLPHWMDIAPARGYLTNFYTAPAARGRGLAKELLRISVEECKKRGIGVVTLHASKFGRPIYERFGFAQNNEMILRLNEDTQGWE